MVVAAALSSVTTDLGSTTRSWDASVTDPIEIVRGWTGCSAVLAAAGAEAVALARSRPPASRSTDSNFFGGLDDFRLRNPMRKRLMAQLLISRSAAGKRRSQRITSHAVPSSEEPRREVCRSGKQAIGHVSILLQRITRVSISSSRITAGL